MPQNYPVWKIVQQFGKGLITRQATGKFVYWGVNFQTIEFAFRLYRVPRYEQPEMLKKILAYTELAIEEEKNDHA